MFICDLKVIANVIAIPIRLSEIGWPVQKVSTRNLFLFILQGDIIVYSKISW